MSVKLRAGRPEDAEILGNICFEAFRTIAEGHNFPRDIASAEEAIGLAGMLLSRPDVYSVVGESDGKIAGSNFLWEGDDVAGVGPITVEPTLQNSSIGKELMLDVIRRADEKGFLSVRLVQAAYHNRSLALYTKLGFNTVEPLSVIQGPPVAVEFEGLKVLPMTEKDVDAADAVCFSVHGISRRGEIAGAAALGMGKVVVNNGKITGYATMLGFFGHSACETNNELKALIGSGATIAGPGFLLPTRNSEVMRWCLENGFKVVHPMTLMSRGVYQEPRGAFFPSILF